MLVSSCSNYQSSRSCKSNRKLSKRYKYSICYHLGISTNDVLAAGTKWNFLPFKPGLVGGHCIGVDPYYLTHKAQAVGYNPEIILAGRRLNGHLRS
jgi:UDP-N-acetyl-D-mannosaminuronate dehydrogenase